MESCWILGGHEGSVRLHPGQEEPRHGTVQAKVRSRGGGPALEKATKADLAVQAAKRSLVFPGSGTGLSNSLMFMCSFRGRSKTQEV